MLGGVLCHLGGYTSKRIILKYAPGLYELPVPRGASGCELFADADGSGHVSIEFRAVTATKRH